MLSTLRSCLLAVLFPIARLLLGGRRRPYRAKGVTMLLDVGHSPMILVRALGLYELRKTAEIERRLRPGGVFIDVGASQGDFALIAARIVGPAGRVLAFEPDPENVETIRANVALNGFETIAVHAAALSDSDGEATLYRSSMNGWHSLVSGLENRDQDVIAVPVIRLDSLALDRLDMIKIDVEGAEQAVLEGARETIARHRPVVLLDTHPSLGADLPALRAYFDTLGYDAFDADRHASRPLPAGIPSGDGDIVLVPRPVGAARSGG